MAVSGEPWVRPTGHNAVVKRPGINSREPTASVPCAALPLDSAAMLA